MSVVGNVGSVPCKVAGHELPATIAVGMGSTLTIAVRGGDARGPAGGTLVEVDPVAARALAQLLLVAVDTLERNAIEGARTIAIARGASRR